MKGDACKKVWQLFQKLKGLDKKNPSKVQIFAVKAATHVLITCRSLCQDKFCIIPIYNIHVLNTKECRLMRQHYLLNSDLLFWIFVFFGNKGIINGTFTIVFFLDIRKHLSVIAFFFDCRNIFTALLNRILEDDGHLW